MKMNLLSKVSALIVLGLKAPGADEVTAWNLAATNAALAAGQSPPVQTRTYAIVHIAIHDALNSIDRRFSPCNLETRTTQRESPVSGIAAASSSQAVGLPSSSGMPSPAWVQNPRP